MIFLNDLCGFVTIHHRHVAVHQYQIEVVALQLVQRLTTLGRNHHVTAKFAEHTLGHQLVDRVVLNQQHLSAVQNEGSSGVSARVAAAFFLQHLLQGLIQRVP